MTPKSAGILMYRLRDGKPEMLLVHPGGPFWRRKDRGSWSIPKGLFEEGEDPFQAAVREFREETGFEAHGEFRELTPLRQRGGKLIHCWAVEGDLDADAVQSNAFSLEWPPHSGKLEEFPEVDRAGWFPVEVARQKIIGGQAGFITELLNILNPG